MIKPCKHCGSRFPHISGKEGCEWKASTPLTAVNDLEAALCAVQRTAGDNLDEIERAVKEVNSIIGLLEDLINRDARWASLTRCYLRRVHKIDE